MNKLSVLLTSILVASISLTGCGGDDDSSNTINSSIPDVINPDKPNQETVEQIVTGTIRNSDGNPLSEVTIRIGDKKATSDVNGKYSLDISNIDSDFIMLIKKDGYLTTARQVKILSEGTYIVDVSLSADQVTTEFESSSGITALSVSGATVTIPSDAIIKADGTTYNGNVKIAANYYNPDSVEGAQAFAQPYIGQDADGSDETGLVTVGVVDVKLTDPATGDKLDLKEGASAMLTFPEASTDQDLPTIPLWYYDEEEMVWIKDGVAIRQTDGSYKGKVTHFTLWNLDIPVLEYSAFVKGCFVYEDTNKPIKGGIEAIIKGRGFAVSVGIDNEGRFSSRAPINTPITLSPNYNYKVFDTLDIPALARGNVYNINDGVCIKVKETLIDNVFTYIDTFAELPENPIIVTTDPSSDTSNPISIETEVGSLGHKFYFDMKSFNGVYRRTIELESVRTTINNTTEFIKQSLYDNFNYSGYRQYRTSYSLTPNGLETQFDETVANEGKFLKKEWYNTKLNNNVLAQRLKNGAVYEYGMQDISLANQNVGETLALVNVYKELNHYPPYVPNEIIIKLKTLPEPLSIFDGNASCKKLVTASIGNQDFISFDPDPNIHKNIVNELDYFSFITQVNESAPSVYDTWSDIPWARINSEGGRYGMIDNIAKFNSASAALEYNNNTHTALYYVAGDSKLTDAEKNECVFYNEAAKDQIVEALKAAYPNPILN